MIAAISAWLSADRFRRCALHDLGSVDLLERVASGSSTVASARSSRAIVVSRLPSPARLDPNAPRKVVLAAMARLTKTSLVCDIAPRRVRAVVNFPRSAASSSSRPGSGFSRYWFIVSRSRQNAASRFAVRGRTSCER